MIPRDSAIIQSITTGEASKASNSTDKAQIVGALSDSMQNRLAAHWQVEMRTADVNPDSFIQPCFVDAQTQARIPISEAEKFGRHHSRLYEGLPVEEFAPNETEWRQLAGNRRLERLYERKVRRGESPSLKDCAPARVKALQELMAEGRSDAGNSGRTVWITDRGLSAYERRLRIPLHELNTAGRVVLDLGSGAQQELAKDTRLAGLRSTVASVDPSLGIPIADDLASVGKKVGLFRTNLQNWYLTPLEYRYSGRLNPERFTAVNESELPFKQYDSVYAQYSIPYYCKADELESALARINGLLAPAGNARVYPIRPAQIEPVRRWFASQNIEATLELQPEEKAGGIQSLIEDPDLYQFHLLTWKRDL